MSDKFKIQQLLKREQFHEKIHAAFILKTSITEFGMLTDTNLSWLISTYPKTEIKTGQDQGANYYTITPKF